MECPVESPPAAIMGVFRADAARDLGKESKEDIMEEMRVLRGGASDEPCPPDSMPRIIQSTAVR